jgi:hypothetical protein
LLGGTPCRPRMLSSPSRSSSKVSFPFASLSSARNCHGIRHHNPSDGALTLISRGLGAYQLHEVCLGRVPVRVEIVVDLVLVVVAPFHLLQRVRALAIAPCRKGENNPHGQTGPSPSSAPPRSSGSLCIVVAAAGMIPLMGPDTVRARLRWGWPDALCDMPIGDESGGAGVGKG